LPDILQRCPDLLRRGAARRASARPALPRTWPSRPVAWGRNATTICLLFVARPNSSG